MRGRTIIHAGTVITGRHEAPLHDGIVVVEDEQVTAVGPRTQFGSLEGEAEIIDASSGSVLPGLIDTHVHIFHEAQQRRLREGAAALWAMRYVQMALRGGVTTIRDLGAQTDAVFGLRSALASGWSDGPDVLACGRAICMTGGHGWANLSVEADGADGVRRAARAQIKAGADVIKVMASGAIAEPG